LTPVRLPPGPFLYPVVDADLLAGRSCGAFVLALARGGARVVQLRAKSLGADGVHLGQDDLPPAEARRLLGASALIGWSTHSVEQVERAAAEPVDYVAYGPVYPTVTKRDADPAVGLDGLRAARALTRHPLVAIGGITLANARAVSAAGADGLAVISALLGAPDPEASARAFVGVLAP
jgi:thiamine-phosphate pyrophosphorylase